jgi:hypothetical protein
MQDVRQRLEKLRTDAEECLLISRLTTVPENRDAFQKLADDYREMTRELEILVINKVIPDKTHPK